MSRVRLLLASLLVPLARLTFCDASVVWTEVNTVLRSRLSQASMSVPLVRWFHWFLYLVRSAPAS